MYAFRTHTSRHAESGVFAEVPDGKRRMHGSLHVPRQVSNAKMNSGLNLLKDDVQAVTPKYQHEIYPITAPNLPYTWGPAIKALQFPGL